VKAGVTFQVLCIKLTLHHQIVHVAAYGKGCPSCNRRARFSMSRVKQVLQAPAVSGAVKSSEGLDYCRLTNSTSNYNK
jgi:hypothetical protein